MPLIEAAPVHHIDIKTSSHALFSVNSGLVVPEITELKPEVLIQWVHSDLEQNVCVCIM